MNKILNQSFVILCKLLTTQNSGCKWIQIVQCPQLLQPTESWLSKSGTHTGFGGKESSNYQPPLLLLSPNSLIYTEENNLGLNWMNSLLFFRENIVKYRLFHIIHPNILGTESPYPRETISWLHDFCLSHHWPIPLQHHSSKCNSHLAPGDSVPGTASYLKSPHNLITKLH